MAWNLINEPRAYRSAPQLQVMTPSPASKFCNQRKMCLCSCLYLMSMLQMPLPVQSYSTYSRWHASTSDAVHPKAHSVWGPMVQRPGAGVDRGDGGVREEPGRQPPAGHRGGGLLGDRQPQLHLQPTGRPVVRRDTVCTVVCKMSDARTLNRRSHNSRRTLQWYTPARACFGARILTV